MRPSGRNCLRPPRACSRNRKRRAPRSIATLRIWRARSSLASSDALPKQARNLKLPTPFLAACELKNKVLTALFAAFLVTFVPAAAFADQEHPPAPASQAQGEHAQPAEGEHHDESIGGMILGMGWPVANFIIFIGVLYYFLNQPIREYLATRRFDHSQGSRRGGRTPLGGHRAAGSDRTEAPRAARRTGHDFARAAPRKSKPKRRALPRKRPRIAIGCSNRPAERSICRCGWRRRRFSSTRPTCPCSSPRIGSRRKSRRPTRSAWSIAISRK